MKLPSDMTGPPARKKGAGRLLIKAAGLTVGIFLIYWFVSRSNLTGIREQLLHINYNFAYLIAATFTAYLMVTLAWKLSFYRFPGHLSVPRLFLIRQIGESLAQVNPTNVIAGDALKAVLLKRMSVPYKDGIVSLTISRFLVLFSALTLMMIGIYLFFDQIKFMTGTSSLVAALGLLFIVLVLLLYRLSSGRGVLSLAIPVLEPLRRRFNNTAKFSGAIAKIREVDEELIDFYKTKKINFILAFVFSFASWLMGALEFYLILYFLHLNPNFLSCIAIEVGVMVFKALGAFIPGQIGIEEYASKLMLEMVDVPGSSVWITVSILRRARQIFWIGAGFIAFVILIRSSQGLEDGNSVHNA